MKTKELPEPDLTVGKLYEYIGSTPRPLMSNPRTHKPVGGSWNNVIRIHHLQTFILLEKLPKTKSYIKVFINETGAVGWIFTGIINGRSKSWNKLQELIRRLV